MKIISHERNIISAILNSLLRLLLAILSTSWTLETLNTKMGDQRYSDESIGSTWYKICPTVYIYID